MPIIGGPILNSGPIIDIVVGVCQVRGQLLKKHGFPVPPPVVVRTLLDTGSNVTGFSREVFRALDIRPFWKTPIYTPSTPILSPHYCDLFHVSLSLVANGQRHDFADWKVIAAEGWDVRGEVNGLIGRDMLEVCNLFYLGPERKFTLAF